MIKAVLFTLVVLLALIALVVIIGALLPREHRATRTITLAHTAPEVYALVRDFGSAASWRRNLTRVEILNATHFRFMARSVFGHESTIDANLGALADRFGETGKSL